ncbi:hypothetical protein JTB14_008572 [Gonioctena quinquepunctata]|nr:hypothetical protein JTB14_008572 [Gonioctena quinquepunctata]
MHSKFIIFLTCVLIFFVSHGTGHNGHRFTRGIRGTHTSTVVTTSVVTSLVPSSCVYVDATLPPCRSVRFLQFPYFYNGQPTSNNIQENNSALRSDADQLVQATRFLGWGEFFGLFAPTVTVTLTKLETTIVQDPRVVVTYAVKGCRPMRIPDDLDRCPQESSTVPIEEILPTSTVIPSQSFPSTVGPPNKPGSFIEVSNGIAPNTTELAPNTTEHNDENSPTTNLVVESSSEKLVEEEESAKPTKALPY